MTVHVYKADLNVISVSSNGANGDYSASTLTKIAFYFTGLKKVLLGLGISHRCGNVNIMET